MPRSWIYFIAVVLLLAFHVLVMDTRIFLDWLWYNGYVREYYILNTVSANEQVKELFGGWPMVVFLITVLYFWYDKQEDDDSMGNQFLLLPLFYVPFLIIGNSLAEQSFEPSMMYMYPAVVVPVGYLYVLPWAAFVWVFSKLRLVI